MTNLSRETPMAGRVRVRRKYRPGRRCQDCGWEKPTTEIRFWATGMRYRVCKECIKPYRRQILYETKPAPEAPATCSCGCGSAQQHQEY